MTPLLEKIFENFKPLEKNAYLQIKDTLSKAIYNHSLPLGSLIPSSKELAADLHVNKRTVERAYAGLKKLGLIEAVYGKDTRVVTSLIRSAKCALPAVVTDGIKAYGRPANFNQVNPRATFIRQAIKEIDKDALLTDTDQPQHKKARLLDDITARLLVKINHYACANYTSAELTLVDGYKSVLANLCGWSLHGRAIAAAADNISVTAYHAMKAALRTIVIIRTDESGMVMEDLETLCKDRKVGLVYMNSRGGHYAARALSPDRVEQLIDLSKRYKFTIIEDDQFGCFDIDNANPLMRASYRKRVRIIYLSTLSFSCQSLNDIVIVCGMLYHMKSFNLNLSRADDVMPMSLVYQVRKLLKSDKLYVLEKKMRHAFAAMREAALQQLLSKGIWKEAVGFTQNDWLIYLMPVTGNLPHNFYQELENRKIFVINPAQLSLANYLQQVVILSLAGYLFDNRITDDLNRFLEHSEYLLT